MTGIEYMQGLFRDTAAMTRDAIAKGDDISMELACKWVWYLHGLTAGAKLADYTYEADRAIAQAMRDDLQQLETEYNERLCKKHETIL